jgi:hypothetical protein
MTLKKFIASDVRNAYLYHKDFKTLYVRKSQRYFSHIRYSVFDIATISARIPNQGSFRKLINEILTLMPHTPIYVESVLSWDFEKKLEHMGFVCCSSEFPRNYIYGLSS